jgi:hypothetical protein
VLGLLTGGVRDWFGVFVSVCVGVVVWGMGLSGAGAGGSGGDIVSSAETGFDSKMVWGLRFEVVGFIVEESDS